MNCSPRKLRRALAPFAASRFAKDAKGVAAVEFAIIAPLMIALYFGVLELSLGYQASRKVSLLSRTAADLSSQASASLSAADMTDIRNSANWILNPFPIAAGQVRMTVSSVSFDGRTGVTPPIATVNWSVSNENVRRACGQLTVVASNAQPSLTTIPTGVAVAGTSIIVADVSYDYKPLIGGSFKSFGDGTVSQLTMSQTSYMKPRNVSYIPLDPGVAGAVYCSTAWHP